VATKHYVNVNYICNEHCVFCASDLTNTLGGAGVRNQLTLDELRSWIEEDRPRRGDEVLLAGGEPTLHRHFFEIVSEFAACCKRITVFTNGVKLADVNYAQRAIEAGVSRFEVAFFGATAQTHDAITRRRGSFEDTIAGINNLFAAGRRGQPAVVVRLLVARHCYRELADIVRAVCRQAPRVRQFSINRLILSDNAAAADAMVSWSEAAAAINEATALMREYGCDVCFWPVPLCVFHGDNRTYVESEIRRQLRRASKPSRFRYLDPLVAAGTTGGKSSRAARAQPDVCSSCRYDRVCLGVEDWYFSRFGTDGLGLEPREQA
jgi:sulfatase maturation enzyme AslB (radical SAM superfamily)